MTRLAKLVFALAVLTLYGLPVVTLAGLPLAFSPVAGYLILFTMS